jgi:outer membrane protein
MNKLILVFSFVCFSVAGAVAQSMKFGHVNSQEVISQMPDYIEMTKVLQEEQAKLMKELEDLNKVYMTLIKEYQDPATTETRKKVLEGDIVDMEQRMQQREESGTQKLEQLSQRLRKPILDKIDKAIKDTAAEGKYNYVFDTAALLFFEGGDDLTSKVKAKVGIQ